MAYYEIFDYEMTDFDHEGFDVERERLYRVHTGNSMDSLYLTAPADDDEDDTVAHIAAAMRKRYGNHGPDMVREVEDVTYLVTEHDDREEVVICDPISHENVSVMAHEAVELDDGGEMRIVDYEAKTSTEVDCTFAIIENGDGLFCQGDWQTEPATPETISEYGWLPCSPRETVSATRAAELLGVSRMRVNQMLNEGKLDGKKLGNTWVVYLDGIENR